jgi:hypothetical protein
VLAALRSKGKQTKTSVLRHWRGYRGRLIVKMHPVPSKFVQQETQSITLQGQAMLVHGVS